MKLLKQVTVLLPLVLMQLTPLRADLLSDQSLSFSSLNTPNSSNRKASIQVFYASSNPYGERLGEEIIINPWTTDYKLVDLQESLNYYNTVNNSPTTNFFQTTKYIEQARVNYEKNLLKAADDVNKSKKNEVLKISLPVALSTKYPIEVVQRRSIMGVNFNFSWAKSGFFENLDFSWTGRPQSMHRTICDNLDLFINTEFSFMNVTTILDYQLGQKIDSTFLNTSDSEIISQMYGGPENVDKLSDSDYATALNAKKNLYEEIEAIRQKMHDSLGFATNNSHQKGVTDLVTTFGLCKTFSNIKSVDSIKLQMGLLLSLPTGLKKDINNITECDFGIQTWQLGYSFGSQIVLKPKYTLNFGLVGFFGRKYNNLKRISLLNEPCEVSPFVTELLIDRGSSMNYSATLMIRDSLKEGVDLKIGFNGTSHNSDRLFYANKNSGPVKSSIVREQSGAVLAKHDFTDDYERYSAWHQSNFEITCNYRFGSIMDQELGKNNIYISGHMPMSHSRNVLPQRKIAIGVEFFF